MEDLRGGLKWIAICSLFLFAGSFITSEGGLPDCFPFYAFSTLYYLTLSILLIRICYDRLAGYGISRKILLAEAILIFTVFLLRGIKYSFFYDNAFVRRFLWYLYYLPFLLIPLCLWMAAMTIGDRQYVELPFWHVAVGIVTIVFIAGVLTNDLHQCFFRFQEGFQNWDGEYQYGICFYLLKIWEYLLYGFAVAAWVIKSRIRYSERMVFVMLIPVLLSAGIIGLTVTHQLQLHGRDIFGIVEVKCYMVAAILGCAIEAGMIPFKENPENLLKISSLAIQITDKIGKVIYHSDTIQNNEDIYKYIQSDKDTSEAGDLVIRRYDLGEFYGFWQEDISKINILNAELSEKQETLMEENELARLENTLKEKSTSIAERDGIFERISKRTERVSDLIYEYTKTAEESEDVEQIRSLSFRVCFLGVYIKRFSNLYLFASRNKTVKVMELSLAIQELLRCLNDMHIPGGSMNDVEAGIDADRALDCYELIERVIEENMSFLNGVYIRIMEEEEIIVKLSLEGKTEDTIWAEDRIYAVSQLPITIVAEDGILYLRISLGRRKPE